MQFRKIFFVNRSTGTLKFHCILFEVFMSMHSAPFRDCVIVCEKCDSYWSNSKVAHKPADVFWSTKRTVLEFYSNFYQCVVAGLLNAIKRIEWKWKLGEDITQIKNVSFLFDINITLRSRHFRFIEKFWGFRILSAILIPYLSPIVTLTFISPVNNLVGRHIHGKTLEKDYGRLLDFAIFQKYACVWNLQPSTYSTSLF